ncbi:MAG: Hsp70 family protein, partial [Verrucomicrobiota bacterium]|nr:Hsp70 family protein [Verrucomicrobiota bacterium]
WPLGEFDLDFAPAPKGVPRVGVQFEIDSNGILHVLARDTRTGREKVVEINSAIDVSDEAVEAMLADSLEHAFEDMSERVWTEAKLKADEMIGAVESAFQSIGSDLPAEEKSRIEQLLAEVQAALASGEAQRLKQATAALDRATEPLAALLVERAMAAAGR